MQTHSERGVALILALFLMTVLSVLAGSLMFLAQTETYATMNYRMMSQARYGAEAGVQKGANYLLTTYTASKPAYTDLTSQGGTLYDNTVSPVKYMGADVVLSTTTADSNYPDSAVKTAFSTAAKGALAAGNASVTYTAVATLLSMQTIDSYGGGKEVIQTWQVVGDGTLAGARKGTVEVMATIESPKMVANPYAAFATDPGCAALTVGGSPGTDSYNSNGLTGSAAPALSGEGGDVGTNGNIDVTGTKVTVKGHLYSPRTGVGACVDGSTNMTALTQSGKADVSGSLVQLPKALPFETPTIPDYSMGASVSNPTCTDLGLSEGTSADNVATGPATAKCFSQTSGGVTTITINNHGTTLPTFPEISMTGQYNLVLVAGNPAAKYNFNSLSESGQATVGVRAQAAGASVVVNIAGKKADGTVIATPLDLTGGSYAAPDISACPTSCYKYDASMLQFVYGGTGEIKMTGNSESAAVFYAPNAKITVAGNTTIYGSMLGKTMDIQGNANIYYDSNLQSKFFVPGNPVIGTFTWKRS